MSSRCNPPIEESQINYEYFCVLSLNKKAKYSFWKWELKHLHSIMWSFLLCSIHDPHLPKTEQGNWPKVFHRYWYQRVGKLHLHLENKTECLHSSYLCIQRESLPFMHKVLVHHQGLCKKKKGSSVAEDVSSYMPYCFSPPTSLSVLCPLAWTLLFSISRRTN